MAQTYKSPLDLANAIPYISQRSPEINKILVRMFKQKAGYNGD